MSAPPRRAGGLRLTGSGPVPKMGIVTRAAVCLVLLLTAASPLAAQRRPEGPLARSLAPLFEGRPFRYATWGALVVSLTRGDTLLSYNADRRFLPASNAKLFTTAAALHYLGPDFRFVTSLYANGPVRDGTLDGDLVLYGTGDPTFALDTADLAPFADSVLRAGITTIDGDVVGDASFLGAELVGPGWARDNLDQYFAARPSALGAAGNLIRVRVRPGAWAGAPAALNVDPPNDYLAVTNRVVTGHEWSRTRIRTRRSAGGRQLTLTGVLSPRRWSWSADVVVQEPAAFAAGLLRSLLEARGITVAGVTRGVTDAESPPAAGAIATRSSESLGDQVSMINHRSHNLSAELVFRSIGRRVDGSGTYASGARAVESFLRDVVGIEPSSVAVSDGSGLSRLDEATPRSLVQLLAYERRVPDGDVFFRSLPVAGDELEGRMEDTPAAGRLRAKSGTLRDASALAGYVSAANGEELAFSIIVNDAWRISRARQVQDEIGARLAEFSR